MTFPTNTPLAWGRVLHDPDLAEAILDRVLEGAGTSNCAGAPTGRARPSDQRVAAECDLFEYHLTGKDRE